MYESPIAGMAAGTEPVSPIAQVDGMFEIPLRIRVCFAFEGLIERRMTDVAIVAYNFAGGARVLAVMTAKASLSVEVSNVIRMRAPVGPHFGEKIRRVGMLQLGDRHVDRLALRCVHLRIGCFVIVINIGCDGIKGLLLCIVMFGKRLDSLSLDERQRDVESASVKRSVGQLVRR